MVEDFVNRRSPNRFVVGFVIVVVLAVGCLYLFGPLKTRPLVDPDRKTINPVELPVVTIAMNLDTITNALRRAPWCKVDGPGFINTTITLTPAQDAVGAFDAVIDPGAAKDTAEKYPQLFEYDSNRKAFKIKVVQPRQHSVVMPVWLVKSMVDNKTLLVGLHN